MALQSLVQALSCSCPVRNLNGHRVDIVGHTVFDGKDKIVKNDYLKVRMSIG